LQFDAPSSPLVRPIGKPEPAAQPSLPDRPVAVQPVSFASGEKAKARDIIAAIRTVKKIEDEKRPATHEEKITLARFAGFGPVALWIFPDPVTRR